MKIKVYVSINGKERIDEDEALKYVLKKLDIQIKENAENKEQQEFKKAIIDWYFSGNYVEEWEDIE